ncbi:MAG: hypothetical protein RL323_1264 [Pseudomonadota bacterium]|jgi:hypothetical protein
MIEIEKGSASVYDDIGLSAAAEMQVKATLASKISEARMLEFMNRFGRDVEIVVRKPSRPRAVGRTSVVFA